MSFLRRIIAAMFIASAFQLSTPGFGVRDIIVGAFIYIGVLALTGPGPKEAPRP